MLCKVRVVVIKKKNVWFLLFKMEYTTKRKRPKRGSNPRPPA